MNLRSLELLVGRLQFTALCTLAERGMRARRREVLIGGVRVPYLDRGAGDPVVLLHGFAANKETWLLLALALSRKRRLLIPDLPGYGAASAIPPSRATARDQADAVLGFLDLLGLERVDLVGNSMGGGISLRIACDAPARVRSMVLIGSTGPKPKKSELDDSLDRGTNPLLPESVDRAEDLLSFVTAKRRWMPRAMRRYVGSMVVDARPRLEPMFDVWHDARGAEGVPEELEDLRIPALVIHGECDRVIDKATGLALAERIPDAELMLMSDVGHVPQLEVPRETARAVDRFLDALR